MLSISFDEIRESWSFKFAKQVARSCLGATVNIGTHKIHKSTENWILAMNSVAYVEARRRRPTQHTLWKALAILWSRHSIESTLPLSCSFRALSVLPVSQFPTTYLPRTHWQHLGTLVKTFSKATFKKYINIMPNNTQNDYRKLIMQ